jgi:sigma-B regulation protein RsbU (phosphoserine phosphatase)
MNTEVQRYRALLDAARFLNQSLDLQGLLQEIIARSRQVMECQACTVFLPDTETGDLVLYAAAGTDQAAPHLTTLRVPKGAGISGAVFTTRQSLNIEDVSRDERFYRKADEKTGFITKSLLTVPLLNKDRCMGVLQAVNAYGRPCFDQLDQDILEAFGAITASALMRLEDESRQLEEAKRSHELHLASDIQQSFLPPPLVRHLESHLFFGYTPARHIGGDFPFAHPAGPGRLLVGMADVSGKGIPAALNMARASATIKALIPSLGNDLGAWVSELNRQMASDLIGGRFISTTFLLLDAATNKASLCCAGQYPPFIAHRQSWTQPEVPRQLPLGVLAGFTYTSTELDLPRGSCWLLFTDGITEARDKSGRDLTEEGFLGSLNAGATASDMFQQAVLTWRNFSKGAPQHDDASLILVDWRGAPPPPEHTIDCRPENLCSCRHYFEDWALHAGYDDITTGQIILACDEALTNIYRYAYEGKGGPVRITARLDDSHLHISLEDSGIPVDPAKLKGRELDDIRPGGLGIFCLKHVFDTVEFIPNDTGTHLRLSKKLPPEFSTPMLEPATA